MTVRTAIAGLLLVAGVLVAEPVVEGEWPRWRGPFDTGVARGSAPTKWSATEGVRWKAAVPGRGFSSPVIWRDRIFLTTAIPTGAAAARPAPPPPPAGASPKAGKKGGGAPMFSSGEEIVEHEFVVMAFDRANGKEVWRRTATKTTPHEGYHRQYGSYASNSPVTDGEVLVAFFGSRGVYVYDLDGKPKWSRADFPPMRMRLSFGEGVAPVLHGNTLLLVFDHEGEDFLLALDKSTGKELWRTERDEISNWAAPLVIEHGGRTQVVVSAPTKVRSYDIRDGRLIWECGGLGANTIPTPVFDGEMVYVMSGFRDPNLLAIRLEGAAGDITGSAHVVWTNQRGNSYTASPVLHDGILYFVTDNGLLSAFEARTGQPHYQQQRLPNPYKFKSSPVAAGGRLYLSTEEGDVVVLELGPKYEVVAVNSMGDETFVATPAFADGKIYLRGRNTLYAIGK